MATAAACGSAYSNGQVLARPEADVSERLAAIGDKAPSADANSVADANTPPSTPPPAVRIKKTSEVAGIAPVLTHAIVLQGALQVAGTPEALVFIASDEPTMCAHLQAGTMPKQAQILAIGAFTKAYGKPEAGQAYLPSGAVLGHQESNLHAYFRQLDAQCRVDPRLGALGAEAFKGGVQLSAYEARHRAKMTFALDMVIGSDDDIVGSIEGALDATYCDAPEFFHRAQKVFFQGVDPEDCR